MISAQKDRPPRNLKFNYQQQVQKAGPQLPSQVNNNIVIVGGSGDHEALTKEAKGGNLVKGQSRNI